MNSTIVKPMLAATIEESRLEDNWPYMAQPKIDGIRAIFKDGQALSRSLKPIPNRHIQSLFAALPTQLEGLDGELILGDPTAHDVYNRTQSAVMSHGGQPDITYHVFDIWNRPDDVFQSRSFQLAIMVMDKYIQDWVSMVPGQMIRDLQAMHECEQTYLDQGYEGIVLRHPEAPYKYGRSTAKQGYLLRRKEWADMEARIVGFEELMHNQNEATQSERGYTVHSSHKEGMVAGDTLGALQCVCDFNGAEVSIRVGSGFDFALRDKIWNARDSYEGRLIKFKFTPRGSKDKPRHPIFLGFRDPIDLS